MFSPSMRQRLQKGIVAYWALDESSGTRRASLFRGNTPVALTLNDGAIASTTGPSGNLPVAAAFPNTSGEWLTVGTNIRLGRPAEWTISLWINASTLAGFTRGIIAEYEATGNQRAWRIEATTAGAIQAAFSGDGASAAIVNANKTIVTGTWYHIALRWNAKNRRFTVWFDGVETTSAIVSLGIFVGTAPLNLGEANTGQWAGSMSQFVLWDRQLSNAEVRAMWNNGRGLELRGAA